MRAAEQQTILVTGSTAGLGKELASELAARGVTVLVHGRSDASVDAALADIAAKTGSNRLVPRVVMAAERGGFDLVDLSVSEPSLETVFINLTGKELRD